MLSKISLLALTLFALQSYAQSVPASEENIPYLITFGSEGEKSWGDDDFSQVFFFVIPKTHKDPVFIRVYDPGIGGALDEQKGPGIPNQNFQFTAEQGALRTRMLKDIIQLETIKVETCWVLRHSVMNMIKNGTVSAHLIQHQESYQTNMEVTFLKSYVKENQEMTEISINTF
jgi:hypothetical protein